MLDLILKRGNLVCVRGIVDQIINFFGIRLKIKKTAGKTFPVYVLPCTATNHKTGGKPSIVGGVGGGAVLEDVNLNQQQASKP